VAAALDALGEPVDGVVNFQGDAVLTPPWVLQALVDVLRNEDSVEMVTPAVRLDRARYDEFLVAKENSPSSGTTVTMDHESNALYFSKRVIPFIRNPEKEFPPVFRHIGLYGYTVETLRRFTSLLPTALEKAEGLEQLRALHNGIPIRVVEVDYRGRTHWSIDTPEDVSKAEEIIAREGEFVGGRS
jgi:3-deoxy-manno-octulosonate cytidylyltransferase (CMP-KDO synthetase)